MPHRSYCGRVILLKLIVFQIVKIFNLFLDHGVLSLLIVFQGDIRTRHRPQVCDVVDFCSEVQSFRNTLLPSLLFPEFESNGFLCNVHVYVVYQTKRC